MKITIGDLSFENIKDFCHLLETTFEQDNLFSGEVSLLLRCDDLKQEDIDELIDFLLEPERACVYQLKLASRSKSVSQLVFDDAYLASKRQKFSLDFQRQIAEASHAKLSFHSPINKIRKAKINWIEGTQGGSVALQLQQQPQLQHQQYDEEQIAPRKRKNREPQRVDVDDEVLKVPALELGELVDRISLDTARWDGFAKSQLKSTTPDLLLLWDRLVGQDASKINELDRKITHVQSAAMEQIIRNYSEFAFGLIFENLPAGFYLQQTDDGKNVLCFSKKPELQHLEQINPLTLTLELPRTRGRVVSGSSQQFTLVHNDSPNRKHYEAEFTKLFAAKTPAKQRKVSFEFFLGELAGTDIAKLKRIKELLTDLALTDLNYQGLAQLLIHTGPDGVLLVAQQLKVLNDHQQFKEFNALFLDKPENYEFLLTPMTFEHFKKLSELNREQKAWWISLVSQHKAAGGRTDFNELFAAYDYFLNELESKELTLPLSCPLEKISHMKVALDRLLFIVTNSSDPEEQMTYLDGLDYDAHGAYFASRYNHYNLVSRQMSLRAGQVDRLDYSMPKTAKEIYEVISDPSLEYEEAATRFYRFVGEIDLAFILDVYQKMEQKISNDQRLDVQDKTKLLGLVALVFTGERAYTNTADPFTSFKSFLEKFILLGTHIDYALSDFDLESMAHVDELNQLLDILLLTQKGDISDEDNLPELITLTLSLIANFDAAAAPFIENYKRRFAVEQTGTAHIHHFSFSGLVKHLVLPSKLNQHLRELFAEEPETLAQFIVLLSLCSDAVPSISSPDEDDSEFETKIKALAEAIHSMSATPRGLLLSILNEMDIEDSSTLPSLDQLTETVNVVKAAEEEEEEEALSALVDGDQQKMHVLTLVSEVLPDTTMGQEHVNESGDGLFSLMKRSLDELDLDTHLAKVPEQLQSYLSPWYDAHREVMWQLSRKPIDQDALLDALIDEEQEVKNLLGSRLFAWKLSSFPQAKDEVARVLGVNIAAVDEFFTKRSLLVFLYPRIQASYQSSLSIAIKSLHTSNQDFDEFLMGQIKEINTQLPIDKALMESSQHFDDLNCFVNALIRIKNKGHLEFRRCVSLFTEEMKRADSLKASLTVAQMKALLETLSQSESNLISGPLTVLCEILQQSPNYSEEQLNTALSQVAYLTQYRNSLDPQAYETLLALSFAHNLSQKSLFPLTQLMSFKALTGVGTDHSEALFDALLDTLKQKDADVGAALLKRVIDKTTVIIQTKATIVPALVPLLTVFLKTCKKGMASEFERYYDLVEKLDHADEATLGYWVKILNALGESITDENILLLFTIQEDLVINTLRLKELAELFDYPPYPELKQFAQVLKGYDTDVAAYINAFDKDPKSARIQKKNVFGEAAPRSKTTEEILNEQFDTSQVARVVAGIKNSVEGTPLSAQQQHDLAQQVIYINAVGRTEPLAISANDDAVGEKIIAYTDLTKVSRAELKKLSKILIDTIREPEFDEANKLKAQLRLLAVLREQYFRATGLFVNSTQLLAVLLSLKNPQHNLLLEQDSDESQSITTALIAVMQWVEADGGTVDVCHAKRELVVQDYQSKGAKDFFTSLGIASSSIEAESPKGTYKVGGINYSSFGDLALYRSRAKVDGERLTVEKKSSDLILNVSDFSELNEKTLFHLAVNADATEPNPHAWVYPLVNQFIKQEQFRDLDPTTAWGEDQDIAQLREFLDKNAPTGPDKVKLKALEDTRFNSWFCAAIEAQRLIEGEDFFIPESKTALHVAVPMYQKEPQECYTISKGIQQFLHARLQEEHPEWEFAIEPEMLVTDSVSVRDLFDDYKKQGRIIATSRTLGTKNDLVAQCDKCNIDIICKIPPHKAYKLDIKSNYRKGGIETYSTQSISAIQKVVLKQFEEWSEFLHLVYPQSEWKKLNLELLTQKEELIFDLDEQWTECLVNTPSIGRDTDKKQYKDYLDRACHTYEIQVSTIWEKTRTALQDKAKPMIQEGSVNALRCHYLEEVSLPDQLIFEKLAARQNKKELRVEQKKSRRYIKSGMDVNGAMLHYSDGDVEPYREEFANSQVKLFAEDIAKIIKNNVFLTKTVRSLLVQQVKDSQTLGDLVLLLVDYSNLYLPEEQFAQKYTMQPIIQELLQVYQKAEFEETAELIQLKASYFGDVTAEIVADLESTLSWAMPENRGLGYWLERSAVTHAADAILPAVQKLKDAVGMKARQVALMNLYKILRHHEAQLDGLWLFSFGHKNTRDLIQETLATLDGLTAIGADENALNADFILDCKEVSIFEVMKGKLASVVQVMESKGLLSDKQWREIIQTLTAMQKQNKSIYAFFEMYYYLSKKVDELGKAHSKLRGPVAQLRGEVRSIFDKFSHDHPDLMSESKYFARKATKFQRNLNELEDVAVNSVSLRAGHNGFNDYLDLIIEGSGSHALLNEFTQYNSRAEQLTQDSIALEPVLIQANTLISTIDKLQNTQLPLLRSESKTKADVTQFPDSVHEQVKEILVLQSWCEDEVPKDLSVFSREIQKNFHDRELLKAWSFDNLNREEIAKLQSWELKSELTDLYDRITEASQPKSWLAGITSYATSFVSTPETREDWQREFEHLVSKPKWQVQYVLYRDIDIKQAVLVGQLAKLRQQTAEQAQSLKEQIAFLEEKAAEEEAKGGTYIRRFEDPAELFEFEARLAPVKAKPKVKASVVKNPVNDKLFPEYSIATEHESSGTFAMI